MELFSIRIQRTFQLVSTLFQESGASVPLFFIIQIHEKFASNKLFRIFAVS